MKSALWKCLTGFALVSVLSLALNCGPACEADSVGVPANSESSPCHQDQNPENSPGCDWDSGSLSLEGIETQSFKFFAQFSVLLWLPIQGTYEISETDFTSYSAFPRSLDLPTISFAYLSSVRLLI